MPKSCCVTGCKSNYYQGSYVSVFSFPKCEVKRKLWLSKIPRDFEPTKNQGVCIEHFSEDFIVRYDEATRDDGTILRVKRSQIKLSADAYPSYFPNCPKYLSEEPTAKRRKPDQRRAEAQQREDEAFAKELAKDTIKDYFEFCKSADLRASQASWKFERNLDGYCSLYKICDTRQTVPRLAFAVRVHSDMTVEVFTDNGNTGIGKLNTCLVIQYTHVFIRTIL